ncbi:MAG: dihydroorotate dehydrogenase [Acidobacteriota bacterium]
MATLIRADERLTTAILGLKLANPVLVASGPVSDSLPQIQRALNAGAGGVVTKTIYVGDKENIIERVKKGPAGVFNSTTYSRVKLEQWLRTLAVLAEQDAPVITSIYAHSPEQLGNLALRIVEAGSRALEIGVSCPNGASQQVADWRLVGRYAAAVRKAVDVPFSVKLAAVSGLLENVKASIGEGSHAISLSDALPSVLVDFEHRRLAFGGPVAYSGPAIKPIVLHSIYELRQAGITCPIFGIGGVGSASDVLEYLEVGANAVQLYTMLMTSGIELLSEITGDLSAWCKKEGVTTQQLIGAALPGASA